MKAMAGVRPPSVVQFAATAGSPIYMPLELDDAIHLDAAQGFVGLGMYLEANGKLDEIGAYCRHVPEVLAVRVEIFQALEKWEAMAVVARKLAEYHQDEPRWWVLWADATRRARGDQRGEGNPAAGGREVSRGSGRAEDAVHFRIESIH